ncbi:MAG: SusC/RagA family TonB-linked outer membrane protein [Sphingobacteriales bacterium]|nr:SusC/RagA family TonB-linked outer membrane protein [Sphingobacteriales bacterium]
MLLLLHVANAQLKTITGVVKDEKGAPVPNANISAKGAKGVQTSDDGTFSISVPASTTTIEISSVGFAKQTVKEKDVNNIKLKNANTVLDDVVVNVGYGTQRRKDVTGSISSVSGKDIKNLPTQDVATALQGRVAGVDVSKGSGEPGAPAQIIIHGSSSLNQPQPLYIVDGVRQSADYGATAGSNINPSDIASIDILKDASASGIYGAAAAGGVIIITTKRGQGAKPTVNFSARYGVTTPRVLKLLDRDNFIRAKRAVQDPNYPMPTLADPDTSNRLPNTDWVKAVFRNGTEENYNISVSGASGLAGAPPTINYYVSGVYNNQKGVYIKNASNLYGAKLNTDIKINNRIKVGEQIDVYQRSTSPVDYAISNDAVLSPRLNPPFRTVPNMGIYAPGSTTDWASNPAGFTGPNIVGQILSKNRSIKQTNFQGNIYGEVKLPLSLTFRATLGYTVFSEEGNNFEGILHTTVDAITSPSLFRHALSYRNLLNAYTLAHDKSYGNHNINALLGYEQYQGVFSGLFTSETAVGGDNFAYVQTTASILKISNGGYDPNPLVKSVFGRLNYNYNSKYFASITVRQDKDVIKFGYNNRSGIFPAASLGWKVSDEAFMKRMLPNVNLFKIRASYGVVGNSHIPAYSFNRFYSLTNQQSFAPNGPRIIGYSQNVLAKPDIKWESVYETTIGFDAEAWITYLQPITYTAVGLPFGQFYGFRSLGIFKSQAEVDNYVNSNGGKVQPNALPGDLKYQDVNGDGQINDDDRTIIGNPNPKFVYGAAINLNWKGFDLALLFNGVNGVDIYNGVAPYASSLWSDGNTTSKAFGASYFAGNGLTNRPRFTDANGFKYANDPNYGKVNSFFVENGSYLKLKNVQLGYTFSSKILEKAKIKNARLFVMGNNLFIITKYSGLDPEIGSQNLSSNGGTTNRNIDGPYKYPSIKTYSFGIDLTF